MWHVLIYWSTKVFNVLEKGLICLWKEYLREGSSDFTTLFICFSLPSLDNFSVCFGECLAVRLCWNLLLKQWSGNNFRKQKEILPLVLLSNPQLNLTPQKLFWSLPVPPISQLDATSPLNPTPEIPLKFDFNPPHNFDLLMQNTFFLTKQSHTNWNECQQADNVRRFIVKGSRTVWFAVWLLRSCSLSTVTYSANK